MNSTVDDAAPNPLKIYMQELNDLDVICRRTKTAEPVTEEELIFVERFLYFHCNHPDSAFQQIVLTNIKYLLIQITHSGYVIFKELSYSENNGLDEQTCLLYYQKFIIWLRNFCVYSLRLRGNFARRSFSIKLLQVIWESPLFKDPLRQSLIDYWKVGSFWSETVVDVLMGCLFDSFGSNQSATLRLLREAPVESFSFMDWSVLIKRGFSWSRSISTPLSEAASYLMQLAICKASSEYFYPNTSDDCNIQHTDEKTFSKMPLQNQNSYYAIRRLLHYLKNDAIIASKSLPKAAMENPSWGSLRCVLSILAQIDWKMSFASVWNPLICEILDLCFLLGSIVGAVVKSSSPEGYVPSELDEETFGMKTTEYPSQAVVVFAWRTQKEISDMLSFVAKTLLDCQVISLENFSVIGQYFIDLLTSCKHRGAFECAQESFVEVCDAAVTSRFQDCRILPEKWLQQIMDAVHDDTEGFCMTRRSAGLPLLVQTVVTAYARRRRKSRFGDPRLLYETLHKLLQIMFTKDSSVATKVHSLNILRAIIKESMLTSKELTEPWLSLIAQANIQAFLHQSWAVRNSASLLFSALTNRIFGVALQKWIVSDKNKLTEKVFKKLYPDLLDFMLCYLRENKENFFRKTAPPFCELALFPVLTILSRLHNNGQKCNYLSDFIPHVLGVLLNSSTIALRRLALTVLCSILDESQLRELAEKFAAQLIGDRRLSQNSINGMLMLINAETHAKRLVDLSQINLTRLCTTNLAMLLRITAKSSSRSLVENLGIVSGNYYQFRNSAIRMDQTLDASLATLSFEAVLENEDHLSLANRFFDNATFRNRFYKHLRQRLDDEGGICHKLAVIVERINEIHSIVEDAVCDHGNYKLWRNACKLVHAYIVQAGDSVHRNRCKDLFKMNGNKVAASDVIKAVLRQTYSVTHEKTRSAFIRLACSLLRLHDWASDSLKLEVISAIDNASISASLYVRWAVVDALKEFEPNLIRDIDVNILTVIQRLLTDEDEEIRRETSKLFSERFSPVSWHRSNLALFECIALMLKDQRGRSLLSQSLRDVATECQINEEKIFDKCDLNSFREPWLIIEWIWQLDGAPANTDLSINYQNFVCMALSRTFADKIAPHWLSSQEEEQTALSYAAIATMQLLSDKRNSV